MASSRLSYIAPSSYSHRHIVYMGYVVLRELQDNPIDLTEV